MDNISLKVGSSPQIHHPHSTRRIMWLVSAALLPAGIWGIYSFGFSALVVLLTAVLSALAAEFVMGLLFHKNTLLDGSALLTGLLVGYNMPPSLPLYIPAIASIFAIVVVKWTFGGLGANWMNPALGGRVFVFFSWTGAMTNWRLPRQIVGIDAVSGASPLGFVKSQLVNGNAASNPLTMLQSLDAYPSDLAVQIGSRVSFIDPEYLDLLMGNIPGCIGEVSTLLLLVGAVYLLVRGIITWHIPVSYLGVFLLLVWVFGGLPYGSGFFTGDILFHLLTGGLVLGVFFMATDMVTSPLSRKGQLIFGAGAGFLTFLIRIYGSFPEGVSLAIILMNIFVPLIDKYTGPHRFGVAGKEGNDE